MESFALIYFFVKLMDKVLRSCIKKIDYIKERNRDKRPINN